MRSRFLYSLLATSAAMLHSCALPESSSKLQTVPTRQNAATRAAQFPSAHQDSSQQRVASAAQRATQRDASVDTAAASADSRQNTAPPDSPTELSSDSLIDLIEELSSLGTLDPQAHQRLLTDLKQVDPSLWPAMVTTLKASVAYQQRQAEKLASTPQSEPAAPLLDFADEGSVPRSNPPRANQRAVESPVESDATQAFADDDSPVEAASASQPVVEKPADNSVQPATFERQIEAPLPFEQRLQSLILELESQNASTTASAGYDQEIYLRLLYLMAQRREDALRPISALPPPQQEFWTKQLYGLGALLDTRRHDDPQLRAAEAALHLSDATARLRDSASLVVRSLTFCTEVNSYGVYKPFEQYVFTSGQEVLLYSEIENFKSTLGPDGYRTSLNSRYQIFDKQGQQVDQRDFGSTEELCRNRRRDFFIRYQFALPARLYDGAYTLKLTIEDAEAEKVGESSIDFTIKESAK